MPTAPAGSGCGGLLVPAETRRGTPVHHDYVRHLRRWRPRPRIVRRAIGGIVESVVVQVRLVRVDLSRAVVVAVGHAPGFLPTAGGPARPTWPLGRSHHHVDALTLGVVCKRHMGHSARPHPPLHGDRALRQVAAASTMVLGTGASDVDGCRGLGWRPRRRCDRRRGRGRAALVSNWRRTHRARSVTGYRLRKRDRDLRLRQVAATCRVVLRTGVGDVDLSVRLADRLRLRFGLAP